MSGNTFGLLYCVTEFGESHGPAYGGVVDGCPPGLELSEDDIQKELNRRKPGSSRHVTQRQESDRIEILSGVFEGRTTGTAIGFVIRNEDQRSKDYSALADSFRPGHADYTYWQKYGLRDYRGGGRASARETAIRVAAGAIAKKWLRERYGVEVRGHLAQLGPNRIAFKSWHAVNENPFFSPDPAIVPELEQFMDELRASGDSCGARVNVVASGVPVGWGAPLDRPQRRADHGTDHRPPRPLRGYSRDARRGGDACVRADGPRVAPSRAVRRRQTAAQADSRNTTIEATAP